MKYYPVFLNVRGRSCVVIGGGEVGERKVLRLLKCEAQVTVVSLDVTPTLDSLARTGQIHVQRALYDRRFIRDAFLVIGATNQPETNDLIYRDCREDGILINIVDDPERCDFILPALLERGDLSIAISTGGKSPALARKIKEELAERFGPEYAILLTILGNLRHRYQSNETTAEQRGEMFTRLLNTSILEDIRLERWDHVAEIIRKYMDLDISLDAEVRQPK